MNYFKKGRKCGIPGAGRKKSEKTILKEQEQREKEQAKEQEKFNQFLKAENGYFNGFEFVEVFHKNINKDNALLVAKSNDAADCHGVHVGADGVVVYFMVEPEKVKKQVTFNRSIYCF